MAKKWNHPWMFSNLGNKGRAAGTGIAEDDYSDESGGRRYNKSGYPKFTTDRVRPETLNGPVIIVKEGRKKDGK